MAKGGQTPVRPEDLQTDLHFVCFVEAPDADFRDRAAQSAGAKLEGDTVEDNTSGKRLIELDGTREGPVDRGECKNLLKVRVFCVFLCSKRVLNSGRVGCSAACEEGLPGE